MKSARNCIETTKKEENILRDFRFGYSLYCSRPLGEKDKRRVVKNLRIIDTAFRRKTTAVRETQLCDICLKFSCINLRKYFTLCIRNIVRDDLENCIKLSSYTPSEIQRQVLLDAGSLELRTEFDM